jgi:hypothetical protein
VVLDDLDPAGRWSGYLFGGELLRPEKRWKKIKKISATVPPPLLFPFHQCPSVQICA